MKAESVISHWVISRWERVMLRTDLQVTISKTLLGTAEFLKENNINAVDAQIEAIKKLRVIDESMKEVSQSRN